MSHIKHILNNVRNGSDFLTLTVNCTNVLATAAAVAAVTAVVWLVGRKKEATDDHFEICFLRMEKASHSSGN